ncbi:hypothetical protein [Thiosulfatihalobacter marinus]|jgi:hypothetical protein|uniref:hypothetical protein n=1 Tax=Thiosulfatihalobacter marinus TaxID=2792481 RepID=UPI0018D84D5C|nr:hypothetical protein [Thiosulfatihalobacter marinus]
MKLSIGLAGGAVLLLASCAAGVNDGSGTAAPGHITKLSDYVLSVAAPYQDLTAVRIDPTDGCYVYRYQGPVETTYLPLRTTGGNPICTRAPDA